MATEINVDTNRKSPLIEDDDTIYNGSPTDEKGIIEPLDDNALKEAESRVKRNIPSEYIPIKLLSNGRIKGIPRVLHFRDYSVAESQELNTFIDEKPKAIADVLTGMCFEKFPIGKLPIQDILFILYSIQANFISGTITKTIYLDETLEKGTEKGQLYNEDNMEEVDIPISSLNFTYLGKDKNDKDLPTKKIKVPFEVIDKVNKVNVSFKIATLEDSLLAKDYCEELYKDELTNFSSIRRDIDSINEISNSEKQKQERELYLAQNYQVCTDYYKFMMKYESTKAQLIQALQIVAYKGKPLKSTEEKWKVYSTKITRGLWNKYLSIIESYPFGVNNEVEVYSSKLNKKLVRTFGFQLFDFISPYRPKESDQYDVLFD